MLRKREKSNKSKRKGIQEEKLYSFLRLKNRYKKLRKRIIDKKGRRGNKV